MKIKIGTRTSKLALAQTFLVCDALKNRFPTLETEIVGITTRGDITLDKPLSQMGGKGVFVEEIEAALLSGEIDMAVHSAKDLPAVLSERLEISGTLKRGRYCDILVTLPNFHYTKETRFTVGTGSQRRRDNLKAIYPNVSFKDIRGNVDTRLKKLVAGEYDGIILAAAALERLGITENDGYKFRPLDVSEGFLPAPCQGIIAIECKSDSEGARLGAEISHRETYLCFECEREIVTAFGGDCSIPLGGFAEIKADKIHMKFSRTPSHIISGDCEISQRKTYAKELILKSCSEET
jgi:hydroxymethylbilane synthase